MNINQIINMIIQCIGRCATARQTMTSFVIGDNCEIVAQVLRNVIPNAEISPKGIREDQYWRARLFLYYLIMNSRLTGFQKFQNALLLIL